MNNIELRDYFAGIALKVALEKLSDEKRDPEKILYELCQTSYFVADKMIEERNKRGGENTVFSKRDCLLDDLNN